MAITMASMSSLRRLAYCSSLSATTRSHLMKQFANMSVMPINVIQAWLCCLNFLPFSALSLSSFPTAFRTQLISFLIETSSFSFALVNAIASLRSAMSTMDEVDVERNQNGQPKCFEITFTVQHKCTSAPHSWLVTAPKSHQFIKLFICSCCNKTCQGPPAPRVRVSLTQQPC